MSLEKESKGENLLGSAIDLRQDRRQWIKTSATIMGATLLPGPAVLAETEPGQATHKAPPPHEHSPQRAARFFTPEQHILVEELSETIIPADSHSGGAKAAGVAGTIDTYLRETYDDSERSLWREGLRLIDSMSQHYNSKVFVKASPEERVAVLTVLSDNSSMDDIPEVKFFNSLKEMTVLAYYTSKIGIHDDLQYKGNRVIKEYVGCDDQNLANT